ncbi:MAG TPA: hypothetical protein PKC50_07725 [Elusimicrobiota bacterium]|jgi:hypothetical protein|nr:hypothetical protein [Elusimicrobiota bacterium]
MNKVAIAGIFLGFTMMALTANAQEYSGNPDRLPSIGINLGGGAQTGDSRAFNSGTSAIQDVEQSYGELSLDVRLPVSDRVTLSGAIGFIGSSFEATETSQLLGQKTETNGVEFNIGVRFYIH